MRLHSLQVSAFGPFAGTEQVDFDALGADGLFLLHGETGAGKTTVLDAVAFALFGKVPGARNETKRILSDHADAGARPEVRLELTIGGHRVRLVRSPEYQRPKRRGSGTTREQAKAALAWVDKPGSEGLTRVEEVGTTVSELLGMSAEQFFQVVLLPQGEFARFLRAGTEDRAALLQRLFDTSRFGDVESWFREQRKSSRTELASLEADEKVLLGKLATAAGAPDHVPGDENAQAAEWVADLLASAESGLERSQGELARARQRTTAAAEALSAAKAKATLLQRRRRAQQQLAELQDELPRRAACEQELHAARRAQSVAVAATEAEQAWEEATASAKVVTELSAVVQADPDGAHGLAADLAGAVAGWRAEIGRLTEFVGLAQRTATDAKQLTELQDARAEDSKTVWALEAEITAWPEKSAAAEKRLAAATQAQQALPSLLAEQGRAVDAAQAGAELVTAQVAVAEASAAVSAAADAHLGARQHWLDLREQRLQGMAAELASSLEEGQPCPVCGAAEHPGPSTAGQQHVGRAQEDEAHQAERAAAGVEDEAKARAHQATRTVDALALRSGGKELDVLREAQSCADEALRQAEAAAGQLAAAEQEVREFASRRDESEARARQLRQTMATADERCRATQERISTAHQRLNEASGADADVHERHARLEQLVESAASLLAAQRSSAAAHGHAEHQQRKAEALAVREGFADCASASAAIRSAALLQGLERELDGMRDAEASARAVLAEPEVADLADEDIVLDVPQAAHDEAEAALAVAQGVAAQAERTVGEVRKIAVALEALSARLVPKRARHKELDSLADVVNGLGQNSRRISLHAYVLAARLEEVASVASVRLRRMSGDRYEFVHSDAPGAHGTRGGLGLDIRDDYTGAVRSAKTLSGGESFLASLALGLGLADVVAAESGGVLLDTLFIDEGFGSLDSGHLDEVMGVLDDLRAGGRVVGLVSHVDELRQRIPNRLLVSKSRHGSHLQASSA